MRFAAPLLLLLGGCSSGSTLIINADVHIGDGQVLENASVRIRGDRIDAVGKLARTSGDVVIDAAGRVLAPGFIDTHSHHADELDEYRHMPAVLSQGITTIARGMDGHSGTDESFGYMSQEAFNDLFDRAPVAVNVISYSAHGSLRAAAMGDDFRRVATAKEISKMRSLVNWDMTHGAVGLATGLEYEPGIYATTNEVIALTTIAAAHGGRYASHIRDEDDKLLEALQEVITIAETSPMPVHVSHIKIADRALWGSATNVLRLLDNARGRGVAITADVYPYQRWQSNLSILFPTRDFTRREDAEFTFAHTAAAEDIVLSYFAPQPEFQGKSIAEIATFRGEDAIETLLSLTQASAAYTEEHGVSGDSIIAKGMSEPDVVAFLQWPHSNVCSDGSHASGHPRGWGSFPRVLRHYVREINALSLSDAIRKMTGQAAAVLGLRQRGHIKEGHYADLVLLDPQTISDHATMERADVPSSGISHVWVNGVLSLKDGQITNQRAGRNLVKDAYR